MTPQQALNLLYFYATRDNNYFSGEELIELDKARLIIQELIDKNKGEPHEI